MVSWLEEVCAVWATVSHVWAELSNKSGGVWDECVVSAVCFSVPHAVAPHVSSCWLSGSDRNHSLQQVCVCVCVRDTEPGDQQACALLHVKLMLSLYNLFQVTCYYIKKFRMCLSRGENQKGVSDIFGEMEIYIYIYIKWKLLMSSFYWQKYCHPWVYKFVL